MISARFSIILQHTVKFNIPYSHSDKSVPSISLCRTANQLRCCSFKESRIPCKSRLLQREEGRGEQLRVGCNYVWPEPCLAFWLHRGRKRAPKRAISCHVRLSHSVFLCSPLGQTSSSSSQLLYSHSDKPYSSISLCRDNLLSLFLSLKTPLIRCWGWAGSYCFAFHNVS